jgi:lysophospholipid acyltransferase (LPLAT)-like uncharacterized protein
MGLLKKIGPWLAVRVGPPFVRALGKTWRLQLHGSPYPRAGLTPDPCIYCFWHENLAMPLYAFRDTGVVVMTSEHRDGQISKQIMERQGFKTVSGSSTRGGAKALIGMMRLVKEGLNLCIPPDGPKGPARRVKSGAIFVASRCAVPIVPVGIAASSQWRLGTWDRMKVPKPFSRVAFVCDEPLRVPDNLDERELDTWAGTLASRIERSETRAREFLGSKEGGPAATEPHHAAGNARSAVDA